MKGKAGVWFLSGFFLACGALGEIEFVQSAEPEALFSGPAQRLCITIKNSGNQPFQGELHYALTQIAGRIAAPVSRAAWKQIHIFPRQTVIECQTISFPAVRSATQFTLQWLNGQRVLGRTDVFVYPTNLLDELKTLITSKIGVIDPGNVIKPVLTRRRSSMKIWSGRRSSNSRAAW